MSWRTEAFALLQKTGKSLMLPVSVLPVAGILLGVGSAHFTWIPEIVSNVMAQSGGAIFSNLPLIFAIGVALGVTANDGVAALASVVGYVVLLGTMGVMGALLGYEPKAIMGIPSIDTGVFGGIVVGSIAGWLFNKYYRIQLPAYLGFFAGKRFVPIVTALAAIVAATILSLIWPPVARGIDVFSRWASSGNPAVAFAMYGFVERLLIPFGLHHIWNVPFFFEVGQYVDPRTGDVIRGEIYRYTAGDPTAGNLAGGYLFKMWGLPAAAIAMWHSARPENRTRVSGIMISAALTSFLTGITEPIEFSFLFLAPLLYGLHAVLAGVAYFVCIELGIRHSTTFSHGLIDYVLLFGRSTHGFWYLWLGPIWALVYYGMFRYVIRRFDLKTPGREVEDAAPEHAAAAGPAPAQDVASELVLAFGGRSNIRSLDACITRLRVEVNDLSRARPDRLKALGATGVVTLGSSMQAVFGTRAENLKSDMEAYLQLAPTASELRAEQDMGRPAAPVPPVARRDEPPVATSPEITQKAGELKAALGGEPNIETLELCALTRLRVTVKDPTVVHDDRLRDAGAQAVMRLPNHTLHIVLGPRAPEYAGALSARTAARPRRVEGVS